MTIINANLSVCIIKEKLQEVAATLNSCQQVDEGKLTWPNLGG